mgnify:FL=1
MKKEIQINKLIKAEMNREYFFVKGNIPIDTKYFIEKINQGVSESDNNSYKTNVVGPMTHYKYFVEDDKFFEILLPMLDLIDSYKFKECDKYELKEAWGYIEAFSHYTMEHRHLPAFLSGAVMLTDHSQSLYFKELDETIESKVGNFVLFSSFLAHSNKRNITKEPRYGLSFNIYPNNEKK